MSQFSNRQLKRKRTPVVDGADTTEGQSSSVRHRTIGTINTINTTRSPRPVSSISTIASVAGDESADIEADGGGGRRAEGEEVVSEVVRQVAAELGMNLFRTLKKAKNRSGQYLASAFMRAPATQQGPYDIRPSDQSIFLNGIRAKLEAEEYVSFDSVKADFDLCFEYAKWWYVGDISIWSAADDLQRLADSTYKALLHNEYRSRLDMLVEKRAFDGHRHAEAFMMYVPEKECPNYYWVIKKPMTFNIIHKRIERKEYASPRAFMHDVELIFTNAIACNEDHSEVWEDAKALQAMFRSLCADWPAEYADTNADASGSALPQLKLKVPPTKVDLVTVRLPHMGGMPATSATTSRPQQPQPASVDTSTHHSSQRPLPPGSAMSSSIWVQSSTAYAQPTSSAISEHLQASTEGRDRAKVEISTSQMSVSEVFGCLIKHGCVDISPAMDPIENPSISIAGGSFGDVWQGKLVTGEKVAIKCLRFTTVVEDRPKGLKRLMRETYMWSKIKHNNVQQLMGITMLQGRLGMVSLWREHGNMQDYIRRNPGVDRHQFCVQIASGVSYLHSINMVHGDIKALNILVSADGVAKLNDFDHSILSNHTLIFSATTRQGGGTLRWMAPELLLIPDESSNKEVLRTTQTDVYALGMTILEIFTGKVPYTEYKQDMTIYGALLKKKLPARPEVLTSPTRHADEMWGLLGDCWNRNPGARPDAVSVLSSLQSLDVKPPLSI